MQDLRTGHERLLDSVLRAQRLLAELTEYVEEMEQMALTAEQEKLVHDYATKEMARLQHYIASVSAALLELQSITGETTQSRPPEIDTQSPPRKVSFASGSKDDMRRRAIKASAREKSPQNK